MKQSVYSVGIFSLFILASSTFAAHKEGKTFKPYLGSKWEHLGLLPYDECNIVTDYDSDVASAGTLGLGIVGVSPLYDLQDVYLSCKTGEGDYAYSIPIELSEMYHVGPIAELSRLGMTTFTVNHLDQKNIQAIYGTYHGVAAGLTIGVGARGGYAWNSTSKVRIKFRTVNMLIGVSGTYVRFSIRPKEETVRLYLPNNEASFRRKEMYLEGIDHFTFVRVDKNGNPRYLSNKWLDEQAREAGEDETELETQPLLSTQSSR